MNLGNNERNSLLSQYLTVGPLTGYTKDGRKIHEAKCKLCHQIFSNDRSGYKHLRNVHKISFNEHRSNIRKLDEFFDIQSNNFDDNGNNRQIMNETPINFPTNIITESQKKLVLAICKLGIPLQTIGRREWLEFLEQIGASFVIKPKKLRSLLMIYMAEIKNQIRREIAGKSFTLITDGGTVCNKTYYVCVIFCDRRLYFAGLAHVLKSDHESMAKGLHSVLEYYLKKNSTIIGVVSDNASNILLATTDKSQPGPKINLQNQVTNIQSLIGMRTLHISCGIHTSNLVLKDMMVNIIFHLFRK